MEIEVSEVHMHATAGPAPDDQPLPAAARQCESIEASYKISAQAGSIRYDVTALLDGQPHSFFYEIEGDLVPPPVERADFIAIALVFFAMRHGRALKVAGPVSRQLLINLEELQRAWALWVPDLLTVVDLAAAEEVDDVTTGDRRAVSAFSGGVDATFALVRHALPRAGRDRCELAAAVLVHGFDIPLDKAQAFATARANAKAMADKLGVPLSVVTTNWKAVCVGWEYEFAAALASCLALFSRVADIGLMGSDEDYANFVVPWGSNPITNHLMSSESFRIATDGGGFSRTEKVAQIAAAGVGDQLRVCWQGPQTGQNCGKCEKCMRTKLNFIASGNAVPQALGGAPSALQVLGLRAWNKVQVSYLKDIVRHGRSPLMVAVRAAMVKNVMLNSPVFLPLRQLRKAARRKIAERAGASRHAS